MNTRMGHGGRWMAALLAGALSWAFVSLPLSRAETVEYVFSANQAEYDVSAYRVGADGRLIPLQGSPYPVGRYPVAIAAAPDGRTVYVANQGAGTISVLRAEGGRVRELPGSPFAADWYPYAVAVDPEDRFV